MALRIVRCPLKLEQREQAIILDGNDCSAVRKGSGGSLCAQGLNKIGGQAGASLSRDVCGRPSRGIPWPLLGSEPRLEAQLRIT